MRVVAVAVAALLISMAATSQANARGFHQRHAAPVTNHFVRDTAADSIFLTALVVDSAAGTPLANVQAISFIVDEAGNWTIDTLASDNSGIVTLKKKIEDMREMFLDLDSMDYLVVEREYGPESMGTVANGVWTITDTVRLQKCTGLDSVTYLLAVWAWDKDPSVTDPLDPCSLGVKLSFKDTVLFNGAVLIDLQNGNTITVPYRHGTIDFTFTAFTDGYKTDSIAGTFRSNYVIPIIADVELGKVGPGIIPTPKHFAGKGNHRVSAYTITGKALGSFDTDNLAAGVRALKAKLGIPANQILILKAAGKHGTVAKPVLVR